VSFQFLQVRAVGSRKGFLFGQIHLPMENVEAFDAQFGRLINHSFDWHFFGFEMPIRVSRDTEFDALFARGIGHCRFIFLSTNSECRAETSGAGKKRASIHR
jgi:hypothetical protein